MNDLRTAAQQALEALEDYKYAEARDALRVALAEHYCDTHCTWADHAPECPLAEPKQDGCDHCNSPLYAAIKCRVCGRVTKPAPPQRKPLTEEEISNIWDGHVVPVFGKNGINPIVFARAIEAKHGIGGQQ